MLEVDQTSEVIRSQLSQPVTVEVQGSQGLQVNERERLDGANGVAGQSEIHQACHVGKILSGDLEDEVATQPELHSSPVDVQWDEEQAFGGAQSPQRL